MRSRNDFVEPEPAVATYFSSGADFYLAGAESRSAFFKAAPAASFWQAKKESLVETKYDLRAICNGKCDPKKTCINN